MPPSTDTRVLRALALLESLFANAQIRHNAASERKVKGICLLVASREFPPWQRGHAFNVGGLRSGRFTIPIKVKMFIATTGLRRIADARGTAIRKWSLLCMVSQDISTIWRHSKRVIDQQTTKLGRALQATARRSLTAIYAILDTSVNMVSILAKVNAFLDSHACRVCEL